LLLLIVSPAYAASHDVAQRLVCPWMRAVSIQSYSEACFPEDQDEHRAVLNETVTKLGDLILRLDQKGANLRLEFKSRAWTSIRAQVDMNPDLCQEKPDNSLYAEYRAYRDVPASKHRSRLMHLLASPATASVGAGCPS
jgi:hypothetical protein